MSHIAKGDTHTYTHTHTHTHTHKENSVNAACFHGFDKLKPIKLCETHSIIE